MILTCVGSVSVHSSGLRKQQYRIVRSQSENMIDLCKSANRVALDSFIRHCMSSFIRQLPRSNAKAHPILGTHQVQKTSKRDLGPLHHTKHVLGPRVNAHRQYHLPVRKQRPLRPEVLRKCVFPCLRGGSVRRRAAVARERGGHEVVC